MKYKKRAVRSFVVLGLLTAVASGCQVPSSPVSIDPTGGGGGGPTPPAPAPTSNPTPAPTSTAAPDPTPTASPTSTPTASPPSTSAASCVSTDANHLCIGLKLVSLVDNTTGIPSINNADAITLVQQINAVWSQCDIGFQLENYQAVDPTTIGLDYGAASESELTDLRNQFSDTTTFLVVIAGPWTGSTIAWTEEGGYGGPFGTIVEDQYGHNPYTVGHELGHYQGLFHVSDSTNLMNPYIGLNTSNLTSSQCQIAQQTDTSDWQPMLRH